MKVKGKGKSLRAELSAYRLQACAANCLQSLRASMKFPNKRMKLMKALLRMWRLLVIRGPPSDSDGERPRPINGQLVSPQHLWEVGCRIYMTAVPDIFRAWLAKADWRADWRGVLYLQCGPCIQRPPAHAGARLVLYREAIRDPEACLYIFSEKIKEFQPSCRDAFM